MWGSESVSGSDMSESLELIVTFAGSYPLSLMSRLILSTSLAALTTRTLLTCARSRCQRRICLFWLIRCVGRPRPVVTIAFWLMVAIALPGRTRSSIKRFLSLLASAMISPFLIRVIALGSSW